MSTIAADEREDYDWKFRLMLATVPSLVYILSYALFRTCRVTCIGKEHQDQFLLRDDPILFVSWHQGSLYHLYHFRNFNGIMMASQSKDGELMAKLIKLYGLQCGRGSSTRGGKEALDVMIDTINRTRCCGGMVPDGPRGPFGVAKIGIVKLAKETGLPLIPMMWWAKRNVMLKSWDKHLIPLPFTDMVFIYEAPIFVERTATVEEMEKIRANLTDQLNRMHREAQKYFGKVH